MNMLYLIGLGLSDESDISVKAIEAVRKCDMTYMELFTNNWTGSVEKLEGIVEKKIEILKREVVESSFLINKAKENNVALLVPGDPLAATTHFQLISDAKSAGVEFQVIHASSIYTAVAETGLQLYKFGRATTLPKPQKGFDPDSPVDTIRRNMDAGLHTLVLLDVGMTARDGLNVLKVKLGNEYVVVCSLLGSKNQEIRYGRISDLLRINMNKSPSVLIVPGELNFKEEEALELWK